MGMYKILLKKLTHSRVAENKNTNRKSQRDGKRARRRRGAGSSGGKRRVEGGDGESQDVASWKDIDRK